MESISTSRQRSRLLLAEDDDEVRDLLTRALRLRGYEVVPFATGDELYERVEACRARGSQPPDVIVSDVRLPGHSGLDALARAHWNGLRVPFVLITAHEDASIRAQARAQGARLLKKPLELGELFRAVEGHAATEPASGVGSSLFPYDPDAALEIAERLHRLGDAHADLVAGMAHWLRGESTRAIARLDLAIAQGAGTPETLVARALAHVQCDDLARAEDDLSAALALRDHPVARHDRAVLRWAKGDLDGATDDFAAALRLAPGSGFTWRLYGSLARITGRVDLAGVAFEHAALARPRDPVAWLDLGRERAFHGSFAACLRVLYQQALVEESRAAAAPPDPAYLAPFEREGDEPLADREVREGWAALAARLVWEALTLVDLGQRVTASRVLLALEPFGRREDGGTRAGLAPASLLAAMEELETVLGHLPPPSRLWTRVPAAVAWAIRDLRFGDAGRLLDAS